MSTVAKLSPVAPARPTQEIGIAGLRASNGIVQEEYLPQLQGRRGMEVFRDMAETDATVGALLKAVDLLCRAVPWRVEAAADGGTEAQEHAEFADSLLEDMSHTWDDFVSEALTMLRYGWSYFEMVAKRRVGPEEADPSRRSNFTDGLIGLRKLAPRAQTTLEKWELDEAGGIGGMWQARILGKPSVLLPIDRCLLFRTQVRNGNPEGSSILRNAYRSWWMMRNLENVEAIGHERELAGLPVIRIPSSILNSDDPKDIATRMTFEQAVKDLKFNEQGGLLIPSDLWMDADGKLTQTPLVSVALISSAGTRSMDPDKTIRRHQGNIARSALADFLMLGTDGKGSGSFALSDNKSGLFLDACQTFLQAISSVWNRHALTRVWQWNGMDARLLPRCLPGEVRPADLAALGAFLQQLSTAGATLFPDEELDKHVRAIAGLPEPQQEALDLRARQHEAGVEAMEQGVAAGSGAGARAKPPGEDPDADA